MLLCKPWALLAALGVSSSTILDESFDNFVQSLLEELHVPGLSLAVVLPDGVTETKGYGYARLPNTPAKPDTLWFAGSTTKAFTAAAMGKIVNDSVRWPDINWKSKMSDLLPGDFVLNDEYATLHTTLEDALSHRSGMPSHDNAYGWNNASTVENVRRMRHLPLSAEPRTRWQYNNQMYMTVGEIVQRLTRSESLEHLLRKWFWEPLGMSSTTFSIAEARRSGARFARGYHWTGEHYVPNTYLDFESIAGTGAIISSVEDYALWLRALLVAAGDERGQNQSSPMDQALYKEITSPRSFVPDSSGTMFSTYGLGWGLTNLGSHQIVTHSGSLPGFGTQLFLLPKRGLGVVTMANSQIDGKEAGKAVFLEILERVLGKKDITDLEPQRLFVSDSLTASISVKEENGDKAVARHLPLPGKIQDYLGVYSHPGYGQINFSLSASTGKPQDLDAHSQTPLIHQPDHHVITLDASLSPRTWATLFILEHRTHLAFDASSYSVIGPHSTDPDGEEIESCESSDHQDSKGRVLTCRDEVALRKDAELSAVFELGLDGTVERFGIELEEEMMREAGNWRDGMIWFRKAD